MAIHWKNGAPRTVFISGGGSGIVREFARRLAAEGADLAIFNRKLAPEVIGELRAEARRTDQRFETYSADVSDASAIRQAVGRAVAELGPPELAINSAGIQIAKPFDELEGHEFDRVVAVSLGGSRNFAAAVLPHLKSGDHLVFVASLAAMAGSFAYAAYCASKFGVMGLASCLRVELKLRGIDVSICCPGEVITPLVVEERKTLHPVSSALKEFAGHQEVGVSCDQMLRRIARREFEIIDGLKPRITAFLLRYFPASMRRVSDAIAGRAARKMAA